MLALSGAFIAGFAVFRGALRRARRLRHPLRRAALQAPLALCATPRTGLGPRPARPSGQDCAAPVLRAIRTTRPPGPHAQDAKFRTGPAPAALDDDADKRGDDKEETEDRRPYPKTSGEGNEGGTEAKHEGPNARAREGADDARPGRSGRARVVLGARRHALGPPQVIQTRSSPSRHTATSMMVPPPVMCGTRRSGRPPRR